MHRFAADDEDERVVYDLDANTHSQRLLPDVPPPVLPRPPVARTKTQIFQRAPQPLFHLDDSGDEEEHENPFASLLQSSPEGGAPGEETLEATSKAAEPTEYDTVRKKATNAANSIVSNRRSIIRQSQMARAPSRVSKKKLGFEAADSRPSRWSSRKPSAKDTSNRRKSLGAIQKRRSELEAASAKRRKSLPATPSTRNQGINDTTNTSPDDLKRRSLSDVLQRATVLSQQQNDTPEFPQDHRNMTDSPTDGDAILDTEHQMRAEPFAPQIFSPSKPESGLGRKSKSESIIAKIRGNIGDTIRKAIRKNNRDLTLLRSQGQHLFPQQSLTSLGTADCGSIQERPYVIVCTKRHQPAMDHFVAFECCAHEVAPGLDNSATVFLSATQSRTSPALEVLFLPQTAAYLKLVPGKLLKIYAPLHFVPRQMAAGFNSQPNWLLMCTQLTEVVEEGHVCSGGLH